EDGWSIGYHRNVTVANCADYVLCQDAPPCKGCVRDGKNASIVICAEGAMIDRSTSKEISLVCDTATGSWSKSFANGIIDNSTNTEIVCDVAHASIVSAAGYTPEIVFLATLVIGLVVGLALNCFCIWRYRQPKYLYEAARRQGIDVDACGYTTDDT
ncbi:hypothetical protein PFISCL1PPCAC_18985, partial [Pristionchus fissidentatus]